MILQDGRTVAKGTGKSRRIEVDCVIYAIGDQVDASLGLPFSRGAFVTNPEKLPGDPSPAAYQPYDPETKTVYKWKPAVGVTALTTRDTGLSRLTLGFEIPDAGKDLEWGPTISLMKGTCYWINPLVRPKPRSG